MATTNSLGNRTRNNVALEASNRIVIHTNNSNTASNAFNLLSVAGSSAGDAYTLYDRNSILFSEGLDNSDGDAYIMAYSGALGTTNTFRADKANLQINLPLQSSFYAQKGVQANVTGAGTEYSLVSYSSPVFDQNNNFDITTGNFTAPKTGMYYFALRTAFTDITSSMGDLIVRLRFGAQERLLFRANAWLYSNSGDLDLHHTCLQYLSSGDAVRVTVQISGGAGNTADISGEFSGQLIA